MKGRTLVFTLTVILVTSSLTANAQITPNTVETQGNTFLPKQIAINSGESVTWIARGSPHNISADDGSFQSSTLDTNDTFAHTFPQAGIFKYFCSFHGATGGVGMSGEVYVDTVIPTPTPLPTPTPPPTINVPQDFPNVRDALENAEARTVINIAPGTYAAPLVINKPDVTLRGTGATPSDVKLTVTASPNILDSAHLENLQFVVSGSKNGLNISAQETTLNRVSLSATNGATGISAGSSMRVSLVDINISGFARGIETADCEQCSLLVDRATVAARDYGFVSKNSGPITVMRSSFSGAAVGLRLNSQKELGHIWGNTISATDVGIWVSSGIQADIDDNTIAQHGSYGIAVTGASAVVRVRNNDAPFALGTGFTWDGLGLEVCFDGNQGTYAPTTIPLTNSCEDGAPVGVPYPVATVELNARYGPS